MRNIIFFTAFLLLISIFGCKNTRTNLHVLTQEQKDSIEHARQDSINIADSIANVRKLESAAIISSLSKNFSTKVDEFSDISWIRHKNVPKYRNQNGVYLYFALDQNGKPENLRFCIQYEDDDWLFIRSMIFNIDGENITFIPSNMETDCGNGGRIWEWCDEPASLSDNMDLINKIAKANSVKIKLNGDQYYDTRVMSANSLKAFKETLSYYSALENN